MPVPRVRFPELSYANVDDPPLKRGLIRFLERIAGRDYFAPLYDQWRLETVPKGQPIIRPMLGLMDVELEIIARQWPPHVPPDRPIVLIANHPFGILDGIAAMTMAEDLGRPFRVLDQHGVDEGPRDGAFLPARGLPGDPCGAGDEP